MRDGDKFVYEVESRRLWGDWGDNLINASSPNWDGRTDPLPISRIGPFVPPLYTNVGTTFIRDDYRPLIAGYFGNRLPLRSVIYKHIGLINWHEWDWDAPEPAFYPKRGEPDDYLAEAPKASEEVRRQMPASWELLCRQVSARYRKDGDIQTLRMTHAAFDQAQTLGVFTDDFAGVSTILVPRARDWFQDVFKEWVTFCEVPLRLVENDSEV